jgi:hypothetical protein
MPSGYWLASVITSGPVEASRLACDRTARTGGQQIAEVLIYDRVLTDNERQGTEAYLMAKWFSENTPPVITVPPTVTVEATGTNGAVVNFATTAVDHTGGSIATVNSPPSGSTFPIGSTPVTVTATDAEGYSASTTFTVTVTVSGYAAWQHEQWPGETEAAIIAGTSDPDGDGITNDMEFAMGLSPKTPNAAPTRCEKLPSGTGMEFTYSRNPDAVAAGWTYQVEWSATLASGSWNASDVTETILNPGGDPLQIRATINPPAVSSRNFVRLQVSKP